MKLGQFTIEYDEHTQLLWVTNDRMEFKLLLGDDSLAIRGLNGEYMADMEIPV